MGKKEPSPGVGGAPESDIEALERQIASGSCSAAAVVGLKKRVASMKAAAIKEQRAAEQRARQRQQQQEQERRQQQRQPQPAQVEDELPEPAVPPPREPQDSCCGRPARLILLLSRGGRSLRVAPVAGFVVGAKVALAGPSGDGMTCGSAPQAMKGWLTSGPGARSYSSASHHSSSRLGRPDAVSVEARASCLLVTRPFQRHSEPRARCGGVRNDIGVRAGLRTHVLGRTRSPPAHHRVGPRGSRSAR